MQEESKNNQLSVHHVLAHSYTFYLFFFLVAVTLDTLFPVRIFSSTYMVPIGLIILVLASILILWAQRTSRNLGKGSINKDTFMKGPYAFTRSPTHWGLFFLVFGFGVVLNAIYLIIFSIISQIITKTFFLRKEEALLEDKYGIAYSEYKNSVKF